MVSKVIGLESGVYSKGSLDFGAIYSKFVDRLPGNTGSAASFLGVARLESASGKKKIKNLVMEAYEKHANQILLKIWRRMDNLAGTYYLSVDNTRIGI